MAGYLLPLCSLRRVRIVRVAARGKDLDQLRALCDAGKLRPVIDRVFGLDELAAAHAYSARRTMEGKIAIVAGAEF